MICTIVVAHTILSQTRGNIYAMERRLLWARDHTQQWNKLSDDYIHEAFTTTQQENARKCNRINNIRKKRQSWPHWTDLMYAVPNGGKHGYQLLTQDMTERVDSDTTERDQQPLLVHTSLCGASKASYAK